MKMKTARMMALALFALAFASCGPRQAQAQDAKNPSPTTMASIDPYLMERDAEIAMARSAAPPSIAKDATVMVLGRHGYETAVEGKNGFVCAVESAWLGAFNSTEFWKAR